MCIGIPMQVIESGNGFARCEGMGISREVDTLLVGKQPAGTWLLVFLNSAREVLSEQEAERIAAAVSAVDQVMAGQVSNGPLDSEVIDAMFADLVNREPPKPPSLLALEAQQKAAMQAGKDTE